MLMVNVSRLRCSGMWHKLRVIQTFIINNNKKLIKTIITYKKKKKHKKKKILTVDGSYSLEDYHMNKLFCGMSLNL